MRAIITTILLLLAVPCTAQQETVDETLVRVRAMYPDMVTGAQSAEILNQTAFLHRGEGWALLGKPGGTNCPQPQTATPISCDYLIHQRNGVWYGWDALISTGKPGAPGPAKPNVPIGVGEDMSEAIKSGARSVVQAVDPGTGPEPPTPPVCNACEEIETLKGALDSQATIISNLQGLVQELSQQLVTLTARVTTLEQKPPAESPCVPATAEVRTDSAGLSLRHSHAVQGVCVPK